MWKVGSFSPPLLGNRYSASELHLARAAVLTWPRSGAEMCCRVLVACMAAGGAASIEAGGVYICGALTGAIMAGGALPPAAADWN